MSVNRPSKKRPPARLSTQTTEQGHSLESQTQLIEAAQRGSMRAFEQLIISVERQMMSMAAGMASFPDEADDIFQDAVFNAYQALPKFRAESQFSTWLYRIVMNTALSYKRKMSHKLSRHSEPESYQEANVERYEHPDHNIENSQLGSAISQAMQTLSEKEKVAFVLCHQQELPINEAAEVMDCTDGSVKSYLFRARDKLRKQLHEYHS